MTPFETATRTHLLINPVQLPLHLDPLHLVHGHRLQLPDLVRVVLGNDGNLRAHPVYLRQNLVVLLALGHVVIVEDALFDQFLAQPSLDADAVLEQRNGRPGVVVRHVRAAVAVLIAGAVAVRQQVLLHQGGHQPLRERTGDAFAPESTMMG